MKKLFNLSPVAKVKKSTFDLSHDRKLTMDMGKLYPILVQEAVPGDVWNIESQHLIRFAPMISPVYHRINAYIHYFFVPNRIIWTGWEDFITGKTATSIPQESYPSSVPIGSLQDHMGLPTGNAFNISQEMVNVLPFYAYIKIWNDFYRNQHLQTEIDWTAITSVLDSEECNLLYRNWEKDYFTSCLPTAQDGDPVSVDIDIDYYSMTRLYQTHDGSDAVAGTMSGRVDTGETVVSTNSESLYVDNIENASVSVEDIRYAARLQEWAEKNLRAGNRYVETLLAHFGIANGDARMQRAEYLGGGKSPIVISEVLNTTGEIAEGGLPQGNMSGHGIGVGRTNKAYAKIREHGYILGIMSVVPETAYYQGLPRMYDRTNKMEFYWPEFAQLGEQEVKNREIYLEPTGGNQTTFGYQSRYAEYKYIPSSCHGEFRDTLDFWHLGRKFASAPTLNEDFVTCVPRYADIFAVAETNYLWVNLYNKIIAKRPMPFFNVPRL